MTHTPQLVDRVAEAICEARARGEIWYTLLEPHRDLYRQQARAALDAMPTTFGQAMLDDAEVEIQQLRATIAAMPQPIGYGIVVTINYAKHFVFAKSERAARNWARTSTIDPVVVALVPVDRP